MFILQVILIVETAVSATFYCKQHPVKYDDISTQFHLCPDNLYMTELAVYLKSKKSITMRTQMKCCFPQPEWNGTDILDEYPRWVTNKLGDYWLYCSNGYFMNGLYKSKTLLEKRKEFAYIIRGRCVKPASHPVHYGDCHIQELTEETYTEEYSSGEFRFEMLCRQPSYPVGLHSVGYSGDRFKFLNVKCCTMAQKPYDVRSLEELKERIMATKLRSMAELADRLGYMHCAGVKGRNCGDDYRRDGNVWNAEEEDTYETCNDYSCNERRLHIIYDDWNLIVKNITYGKSITDSDRIVSIDSGTFYNFNPKAEVTEYFEVTKTIQHIATHSTTNSNHSGPDLSVNLDLEVPGILLKGTQSVKTSFKIYQSVSSQTVTLSSDSGKISGQITIQPLTAAKYNVTIRKSRTFVPFTATVIATFTVRFHGFLRGTSDPYKGLGNFHHLYERESKNTLFNYTFGDKNVPFYKALKRESDTLHEPWLWKEMESEHPNVRRAIDNLIDERSYEFSFNGYSEYVSEMANTDFYWDEVKLVPPMGKRRVVTGPKRKRSQI